jgi:hypothetical protein
MFDRNKRCSLTITLDLSSQKVIQYLDRKYLSLAGEMQLKSEFKCTNNCIHRAKNLLFTTELSDCEHVLCSTMAKF